MVSLDTVIIPLLISIKLALVTVTLLLIIGIPLSYWLSRSRSQVKHIIEALVSMPLILPPTVLGFYLLIAMGPDSFLGGPFNYITGNRLTFTFTGLVIGSMIYSLPFVIQPLQLAFEKVENGYIEVAKTLGASPTYTFFFVTLPMAKEGLISATVLGIAHTIGEFGVVLMIGGNIPGKTQVISIAIYDYVEMMDYTSAHILSAFLLTISFCALVTTYYLRGRNIRKSL